MQSDIRSTPEFKAVEAFYAALLSPGEARVYSASDVAPAADGATIHFTGLSFPGSLEQGPASGVYRMNLSTGAFAAVSESPARLPRLSPDGSRLSLVVRAVGEASERLVIAASDGGQAVNGPAIEGVIEQAEWSPDGRTILLLVAGAGADLAGYQGGYATTSAVAEGPAWLPEVSTGQEENLWRRLWLLDVASLGLTQLTRPMTNVWEACWCGPGHVAAVRSGHHGEGSWYASTLVLIAVADGSEQELYRPVDQIGLPAASPDGLHVAFVVAVCSDRGIVCGTPKLLKIGGPVRSLETAGVEVTSLAWRGVGAVHFAGHRAFETVIGDVDVQTLAATELWASETLTCGEWYPAARPLAGRRSVIVAEAYDRAPHIAILEAGKLTAVRSFAGPKAEEAMAGCGRMAPARWRASDGLEIHGWLASPEAAVGPTPLVLDIHGGPVWAHRNRWMGRLRATSLLVRSGCAVLHANPRGSSTRGQDFARLVKGDMGGADTGDFLSAIDHLVASGVVDGARVACTGTSYGGFMSAWLVTQGPRFAAAAPISPVADWYSQHRTSQIPFFDEMFLADSASRAGGKFFDRSPAMFTADVATPCLVMGGALDKNTPPSQALEFHQSLLEHGGESALVLYPRDGHSLRGYPAYVDSAARILIWFGARLGFAGPSA